MEAAESQGAPLVLEAERADFGTFAKKGAKIMRQAAITQKITKWDEQAAQQCPA